MTFRHPITHALLGFGLAALAAGCSSDDFGDAGQVKGTGGFDPQIELNPEVLAAKRPSKAMSRAEYSDITAADLSLRLTSADGSSIRTWDHIADFDASERFNVGSYTLEAFYGDESSEGFESPYFLGSQQIKIEEDKVTPVAISAELANSMVSLDYTDNFTSYMTSYDAEVHSAGGATTAVDGAETRPVYVKAGAVEVYVNFVKPNGKGAKILSASFTAKPRCHYRVTFDLAEGQTSGDATLKVIYDEMLDEKDVEIELNDELLNTPAPQITANGFTSGEAIRFVPGNAPTDALSLDIIARGGLGRVTMTTRSASLLSQGWPAEVNLVGAPAATQTVLSSLGLTARGLYTNPEKMAIVTLTDVLGPIGLVDGDDGVTEITFTAVDAFGKASDAVTLRIEAAPLTVSLANASNLFVGQSEMQVDLHYNGGRPDGTVKIQYFNDRHTWTDAAYTTEPVARADASDVYRATITGLPADAGSVRLRAKVGNLISEELSVDRLPAEVSLSVTPADAFARSVTIGASLPADIADIAIAPVLKAGRLMLSTDGNVWSHATDVTVGADGFKVAGLTPSTTYWARFELDGTDPSRAVTFTTEAAAQLPNSDMEQWYSTDAYGNKSFWVGKTDIKCWYPNASGESFWATRNPRTTGQTSGTTCYYTSFSGTIGASGRSGQAAEISTLGYGEGTTYSHTSSGKEGNPKKRIAGMLFTGDYTVSGDNETITLGRPFTSRPAALSFFYKYAGVNSESFRATIIVENRDGGTVTELGSGVFTSSESVGTFTLITVPVSYSDLTKKSTHIVVKFESSTADSPKVYSRQGSDGTLAGYADSKYIGTQLTVDDIELTY